MWGDPETEKSGRAASTETCRPFPLGGPYVAPVLGPVNRYPNLMEIPHGSPDLSGLKENTAQAVATAHIVPDASCSFDEHGWGVDACGRIRYWANPPRSRPSDLRKGDLLEFSIRFTHTADAVGTWWHTWHYVVVWTTKNYGPVYYPTDFGAYWLRTFTFGRGPSSFLFNMTPKHYPIEVQAINRSFDTKRLFGDFKGIISGISAPPVIPISVCAIVDRVGIHNYPREAGRQYVTGWPTSFQRNGELTTFGKFNLRGQLAAMDYPLIFSDGGSARLQAVNYLQEASKRTGRNLWERIGSYTVRDRVGSVRGRQPARDEFWEDRRKAFRPDLRQS